MRLVLIYLLLLCFISSIVGQVKDDARPVVDDSKTTPSQIRDPKLPTLFIVGDSTLNSNAPLRGWGQELAQFFDAGLPEVCNELANQGIRVIIAGLDMDFIGRPFGPMPNLLAIAEFVTKVHAICVETGNLANYSYRYAEGDSVVQLGEKESYAPLSREAFNKHMAKRKK